MTDTGKTLVFLIAAGGLAAAAALSGRESAAPDAERFSDQGQHFYPEFTDPLKAASLEILAFDEESGTPTPFKVQVKDGVWSIPSHYDYLADGKERLANTASSIMDLTKDIVVSDRVEDHEKLGVVDPLDERALSLKGRGQRATLRDEAGTTLADFIVGRSVEGKEGFRYMRLPDKKRTYAVRCTIEASSKFADWIETNLLELNSSDVKSVEIRDYSIDETSGRVDDKDTLQLTKGDDGKWTLPGLGELEEVDQAVARRIPTALAGIRITGVRPKPESLTQDLRIGEGLQLDLGTRMSLNSMGFFASTDGRLLSNEGEVTAGTHNGVGYTLRFGEVVFGEGLEISAGAGADAAAEDGAEQTGPENRYLFVTAFFDEQLLPPRPQAPEGYVPTSQSQGASGASGGGNGGADRNAQTAPAATEPEDEGRPIADPGAEDAGGAPAAAAAGTQDGEAGPTDGASGTDGDDDKAGQQAEEEVGQQAEEAGQQAEEAGQQAEEAGQQAEEARRKAEQYERELKDWEQKVEDGRRAAGKLNARFAAWYYVITGSDFSKIKVNRGELVTEKKKSGD